MLKLRDRKYLWKKTVLSLPFFFTAFLFYYIISMEDFIFNNEALVAQVVEQNLAYTQSLEQNIKENPWGKLDADNPKAFIMSLLIGVEPALRAKLIQILDKFPEDKLLAFANFLKTIEWSQAQIAQFAKRISFLLKGDLANEKIGVIVNLADALQKSLSEKKSSTQGEEFLDNITEDQFIGFAEEDSKLSEEDLSELFLDMLILDEPDSVDGFLTSLLDLPFALYEKVITVLKKLNKQNAHKFKVMVKDRSVDKIRKMVGPLSKLPTKETNELITELYNKPGLSIADDAFDAMGSGLNRKDLVRGARLFIGLSKSNKNIGDLSGLMLSMNKNSNADLLDVAEKVNLSIASKGISQLKKHNDRNRGIYLDVATKVKGQSVVDLVQTQDRLSQEDSETGLDILNRINAPELQSDLLTESTALQTSNLEKSVKVLDEITTDHVKRTIRISKSVSDKYKNKLAKQTFRMKEATAVAGVRGKNDLTSSDSKTTRRKYGDHYFTDSGTTIQRDTRKKKIKRIENVIDRLIRLNDRKLTSDLLEVSSDLEDTSLVKGADVFVNLDISDDTQRARRLVDVYQRVDVDRRKDSIDALHDMTSAHVVAAVDISHVSDQKLLNDSIDFTVQLRDNLGHKSGIETTMRAINMASLVDSNRDRQRGLDALKFEREVTIKRILIQTDATVQIKRIDSNVEGIASNLAVDSSGKLLLDPNEGDIYTYLDENPNLQNTYLNRVVYTRDEDGSKERAFEQIHIERMTDLYHKLRNRENPENSLQRTTSGLLADVLSGYDGVTLGATGKNGVSRYVTQPRKVTRILQYLEDSEFEMEQRLEIITRRSLDTPHDTRDNEYIRSQGIPGPGIYNPQKNIKTTDK